MKPYRYIYYPKGNIVLESSDVWTRIELNILTRFLFGEGASLDQIFNCGVGGFIKFQNKAEVNKQRAFLTTKVFRYCKRNGISINQKTFISRSKNGILDSTFDFLSATGREITKANIRLVFLPFLIYCVK